MTCAEIQRSLSDALDGEDSPDLGRHLDGCVDCRRFENLSVGVADSYRESVLASQRALRRLDAPRPRRRPTLALAAALLLAIWAPLPAPRTIPPLEKARALIAIDIPDLPASLRSEMDVDLLALARDLPIRLGDPWPGEDVLPRSVAE